MKRRFPGLHQAAQPAETPDGVYLVRVQRAQYRWHQQRPFYAVQFAVIEPQPFAGSLISGRIYCTEKALWKLSWFLRDFGYDAELLGRDEVDTRALVKLHGVVKITHTTVNGTSLLNFVGFAPAARWEELAGSGAAAGSEVA
ncbi:MAG TPA: hypothetical protein VL177_03060 [Terriglobales bacterium]|jgi:hypothetical protein|nr:hypothetical protein [Terriglobales bacterium]